MCGLTDSQTDNTTTPVIQNILFFFRIIPTERLSGFQQVAMLTAMEVLPSDGTWKSVSTNTS
jgi:hypothetical protein